MPALSASSLILPDTSAFGDGTGEPFPGQPRPARFARYPLPVPGRDGALDKRLSLRLGRIARARGCDEVTPTESTEASVLLVASATRQLCADLRRERYPSP